jgi:PAS domain S-box-containing protein
MNQEESKKNEFRKRIQDLISEQQIDKDMLKGSSLEELLEDISVYHQELTYQNQELRRIQEELSDSRQHFVDLFENAPVGYVLFNEDSVIESANTSFAQLVGHTPRELKGQKITRFISPESQNNFFVHSMQLFRTGKSSSIQIDLMSQQKDKTVMVESNRLSKGGEFLVRSAVMDITNEKELQYNLNERIKELDCLFQISNLTNSKDISIDEFLDRATRIAKSSFQFPDSIGIQICVDEKIFSTEGFNDRNTRINEPILMDGRMVGYIAVSCVDKQNGSGKLLPEEADMLIAIAGQISLFLSKREAYNKLSMREQYYRTILHGLHEDIMVIDKDYVVTDVNESYLRKTGYDRQEVLGSKCFSVSHGVNQPCDSLGDVCELKNVFSTGKSCSYIHEHTLPNGDLAYVDIILSPLLNENGQVTHVIEAARDVSDLLKSQKAIKESEERYRSLFENSHAVMLIVEPKSGAIVDANPAAEVFYGWSRSQIKSMNIADINTLTPKEIEHEMSLAQSEQRNYFIFKHRQKNGLVRDVEVFSGPISFQDQTYLYSFIHDITDRKYYEQQVKEQKDFLETLMQTIPNPVFYKSNSGKYIGCNKAFEEFVGFSRDEIIGRTVHDISPKHLAKIYQSHDKQILETKVTQNYESVYTRLDGVQRSVMFDKAPLFDSEGNTMGVIGVITDITERKSAEQENLKNAERLRAIVRLFEHKVESTSELLDFALNEALTLTNSSLGLIYSHNQEQDEFTLCSWSQTNKQEASMSNLPKSFKIGEAGIWEPLISEHMELVVNNIKDYPNLLNNYAYLQRFISIPITVHGRIVAIVGVANKDDEYNETDLNQLKLLMTSVWGMVQRRSDSDKISRLSVAVEQSSASIVITDTKGIIEYVNPKFTKITGYSYQEAIGENPRVLNSGFHDNEFFQDMWDTILSGNDWKGQLVNRKKNGEVYWESASISPVVNSEGKIINFIAVKEDITELKKAEGALRESEMKLRQMIEQSPDGIMLTDENGRIVAWNKSIESISQIPAKKAMGITVWDMHDLLPLVDNRKLSLDFLQKVLTDLLRKGKSNQFAVNRIHEVKVVLPNSVNYLQLTVFAIPVERGNMLACFVRDITLQKMAELAVKEREERLQAIFDNSTQSFAIFSPSLKVQSFNHVAWERAMHLFETNFEVGKSIYEIYPNQLTRSMHEIAEKVLKGEATKSEVPVTDAFGNNFWFELNFSPVLDEDKNVNGIFFNSIDITQRKLAEESVVRSLEKEKELSELKSRFVSTVSHEFRTPLASIYSNSQLLQRYHSKWDEQKKNLSFNRIYESVNMMTGMLENVSLIGKEQTGRFTFRPETINLHEFAAQMVEESHLTLNAVDRVILIIDGDFSKVLLDQVLMRHILINILSNAIKYSPNSKPVEFKISKSKRFIEFYVHDFGVGIPQKDLDKVFDPFFRATNSEDFSGTGLGMTIVKQSVDTHGGTIDIKSTEGKGTEVKILIPFRPM